jgi:hypothetical protein
MNSNIEDSKNFNPNYKNPLITKCDNSHMTLQSYSHSKILYQIRDGHQRKDPSPYKAKFLVLGHSPLICKSEN